MIARTIAIALFVAALALGQGFPPAVAPSKMTAAPGYEVQLVAAEPLVRQPVAIDFDDRGRLWVMQYLQYPNPAGLKRVAVDRFSRTAYDRVPEPPPHGPKGADRLTIVENGKAKDFVGGLNLAPAFAFGHGGVFVVQVPYLLFYPDRDRDDVPDSDPVVCLNGFGMEDAHSVANSLTWGPDGWLYGCQGSTVTANVRGVEFQQGVWRYHPLTHQFELFCEGGGNSWGLTFDATGELIYSTNVGGHVGLHGVQGGYYWKSFGKHGALHNPHAYGHFEHVAHTNFKGGHVTVGGVFHRGKYVAADLLGHGLYWHDLTANGSSFRSKHGGELLTANDTWFAPSDVCVGPDDAIYVADFHDARTAHPDPDAKWDRSNGRVYRVAPKGTPPAAPFDIHRKTTTELLAFINPPNEWFARSARRELADRRDPAAILPLRRRVREAADETAALRALWALHASGGFDEAFGVELLAHRFPHVRKWAVRLLGDERRRPDDIIAMAKTEGHPSVRSQLASTAKRLPTKHALALIDALVSRKTDDYDPHIPMLLWWALEAHALADPPEVVERFCKSWDVPVMRETVLPRLIRRYAAEGTPAADRALRVLFDASAAHRGVALSAIDAGLADRKSPVPADFAALLIAEWKAKSDDARRLRLAMRLGSPEAMTFAAKAARASPDMLNLVAERGDASCVPALIEIMATGSATAVVALARFDRPEVIDALMRQYASSPALRQRIAAVLLGRKAWAKVFLAAVDAGQFPASEVAVGALAVVASHGDRMLDDLVRKHWGNVTGGTPEEKLAEIRRHSNDLRAGAGDAGRGKLVFTKSCAACHQLHGEGQKVGPDLTTANRKDVAYLLQSIVDPGVVVRKEYLAYTAEVTDGRVLTGLIVEQNGDTLTLLDAKNQRTLLQRKAVAELRESPVSLMPEQLLKDMPPQELRDLFAYLTR